MGVYVLKLKINNHGGGRDWEQAAPEGIRVREMVK
jgi:hypothetical protein